MKQTDRKSRIARRAAGRLERRKARKAQSIAPVGPLLKSIVATPLVVSGLFLLCSGLNALSASERYALRISYLFTTLAVIFGVIGAVSALFTRGRPDRSAWKIIAGQLTTLAIVLTTIIYNPPTAFGIIHYSTERISETETIEYYWGSKTAFTDRSYGRIRLDQVDNKTFSHGSYLKRGEEPSEGYECVIIIKTHSGSFLSIYHFSNFGVSRDRFNSALKRLCRPLTDDELLVFKEKGSGYMTFR